MAEALSVCWLFSGEGGRGRGGVWRVSQDVICVDAVDDDDVVETEDGSLW